MICIENIVTCVRIHYQICCSSIFLRLITQVSIDWAAQTLLLCPHSHQWLTQRPHSAADTSPHGAGEELAHSDPGGWCPRWPPVCRAGSTKRRPWPPTRSPRTALHHPAGRTPDSCRETGFLLFKWTYTNWEINSWEGSFSILYPFSLILLTP